ncbi:hypothetical protein HRbin39_01157 [bacterium HR39]|nr:hypothetical protein HRbin39_01157 [bacterium HR39]
MRHAGQVDARHHRPRIEVHRHGAGAATRGADQVAVGGVEEEVVHGLGQGDAPQPAPLPRLGRDQLPRFRDVPERHHEASARAGLVDGRDPRGGVVGATHRDHLDRIQRARIQHREGPGQKVAGHEEAAVGREGDVAGGDPHPHPGHRPQTPQVVAQHPALARDEVDEAPVGRELGPAVQAARGGKAREAHEAVAVDHAGVVVGLLHQHEQIERIGVEHRALRQLVLAGEDLAALPDFLEPEDRLPGKRGQEIARERPGLALAQQALEGRHGGGRQALADHPRELIGPATSQRLGHERRSAAPEPVGAVAFGTEIAVEPGGIAGLCGDGGTRQHRRRQHRRRQHRRDDGGPAPPPLTHRRSPPAGRARRR